MTEVRIVEAKVNGVQLFRVYVNGNREAVFPSEIDAIKYANDRFGNGQSPNASAVQVPDHLNAWKK